METAQVIFINTFYYPDPEERYRLEQIQIEINATRALIEKQERNNLYNKTLRFVALRNKLRSMIKIQDDLT